MALTYTPKRLAQSAPGGTADTTIYTVPGGRICIVKQLMISNVTAGTVTVAASITPIGGLAGIDNRLVPDTLLPGNSVLVFDLSQVMNTGDFISVKTSAGNAVVFTVSGVESEISVLPEEGLQIALDNTTVGTHPRLHLHESQFIDLAVVDDESAGEIDLTITALPQAYTHTQGTPANPWEITHNLGFFPNVTVVDSGGSVVEGDITYLSPNSLQIAFSGAFSGLAYLS